MIYIAGLEIEGEEVQEIWNKSLCTKHYESQILLQQEMQQERLLWCQWPQWDLLWRRIGDMTVFKNYVRLVQFLIALLNYVRVVGSMFALLNLCSRCWINDRVVGLMIASLGVRSLCWIWPCALLIVHDVTSGLVESPVGSSHFTHHSSHLAWVLRPLNTPAPRVAFPTIWTTRTIELCEVKALFTECANTGDFLPME